MKSPFLDYLAARNVLRDERKRKLERWLADARIMIGMLAVHHGLIQGPDIDRILDRQRETKKLFGELAVEMGLLDEKQVSTLLQIQQFQLAASVAQGLALSGVRDFETAVGLLADFITNNPHWIRDIIHEAVHS